MSTQAPEASPATLIDPVRLVCQTCAFEKTVEDADSAKEVSDHERSSPYPGCTGWVYVFIPTETAGTMFALTADSGTAMGETALCAKHFADKGERSEAVLVAAAQGDYAGSLWHDCSENDALVCIACPAGDGE